MDVLIQLDEGEPLESKRFSELLANASTIVNAEYRQQGLNAEHERLRDVVVDAAKDFTKDEVVKGWDALCSYRYLCTTVDALTEFESRHGIKK